MSDTAAHAPRSQPRRPGSLPAGKQKELRQAWRQEWATLVLRITVVVALYAVVGGSQALTAIWFKSLWALLPPVAFLVSLRIESRPPTARFPFGFYRIGSIGFLTAALALTAMGAYLLYAGARALIALKHPELIAFDQAASVLAWPGWWVIAALAWSVIVPLVIGRRRQRHAIALHDKGLYADAAMGRVNWLSGLTAIIGVLGIGFGFWWLDFIATLLIGADVLRHGLAHLHTAVCDLMDEVPRQIGSHELDPLGERIRADLADRGWVRDVRVRLREEGRLLTGIALVCPDASCAALDDFETARRHIEAMDWRLLDFQIVPIDASAFDRFCHDA